MVGERRSVVAEVHPDESPGPELGAHLTEPHVDRIEAVLVSLFAARDPGTPAAAVEGPRVEDARERPRVARRLVDEGVPAVRAEVEERANRAVVAADEDQARARRVAKRPVVVRGRELALVA